MGARQAFVERIRMQPRPMTDDYAAVIRDHQVTVAEHDGAIVGVVVLTVTDEGFLVDNVAAHPSRRGTGLGRALLQFAEAEAGTRWARRPSGTSSSSGRPRSNER
jgi:GNAT superfamily N-acetyltransferase